MIGFAPTTFTRTHNTDLTLSRRVQQHPGGDEVLFGESGRDATEAFEDVGHSDEARALLDKYYVGEGPEVSHSFSLQIVEIIRVGLVKVRRKAGGERIGLVPLSQPFLALFSYIGRKSEPRVLTYHVQIDLDRVPHRLPRKLLAKLPEQAAAVRESFKSLPNSSPTP